MDDIARWCFAWAANGMVTVAADRAALLRETMWNPGDIVAVSFLDGDPTLQSKVREFAEMWIADDRADLTFDFRTDTTDTSIRISFCHPGSWSVLGATCRKIRDLSRPTMNFGWLNPSTDEEEIQRVVLHEFGHALGLIHEHQNPKYNPIEWDRDAVIADLSGPPNYWSLEQIYINLFQAYARVDLEATDFDQDSIMMYPIPMHWTKNNKCFALNDAISRRDAELIRGAYT